jgi:4a-hydroxytetrahydrobiopterin dehydratase
MQGSEQALEASIMRSSKQTLTEEEISHLVHELPEWAVEDGQLVRFWTFPDFVQAVAFVNRVAKVAEAAGHHPDIDIRYNRVRLALVSHDAGGITARDANMARQLSDGPTAAKNPAKKSKAAK